MAKAQAPKVSVIIPMYNAEKYIEKCLASVLNQTLENIEVIVVDDCSTDNSLAIAENMIPLFSAKNKKLLTYQTKSRSGFPGTPRNSALKVAAGEYIYFLDSDDFLSENALEELYKVAKEYNADVVHAEKCIRYEEIDDKFEVGLISSQKAPFVEIPTLETENIGKRVEDFTNKRYLWSAWNKLLNRKFLLENNIKFPQSTILEDLVFSFMCVICAKIYVRVPFVSYYYRIHKDSMSHSRPYLVQILYNTVEGVYSLDKFMAQKKFFSENPNYKYSVIDFFTQFSFKPLGKSFLLDANLQPAEIYEFLRKEIFLKNPEKSIAMASYMFVTTNIYKLMAKQQANEIAELKKKLAELQNN